MLYAKLILSVCLTASAAAFLGGCFMHDHHPEAYHHQDCHQVCQPACQPVCDQYGHCYRSCHQDCHQDCH